jgi:putative ABC transport system permease protein
MKPLKLIFTRRQLHDDLNEEMRLHLDEKIEEFVASGVDRKEAALRAKREFGNITLLAERSREIWRWPVVEDVWANLRYAARRLKNSARFTVICVLTIAIAVGANTAIFTVDYAALLAPLPYPFPNQLVTVNSIIKGKGGLVSPKEFDNWSHENHSFQDITASVGGSFNIADGDQVENIFGLQVMPNYYRTLGNSFSVGRDFLPEEGQEGKNHVVILTHQFWQHLGSDPKVVGRTIPINGDPYVVVGILAPGIDDRNVLQASVPLAFKPEELAHDAASLSVVGRLKFGFSIRQAQDDLDAVTTHMVQSDFKSERNKGTRITQLRDSWVVMPSDQKATLWLLLGAVGFVLLIACANIANLLLAWGVARQKEIAVRIALGATRKTIFVQMLSESLLLATAGGLLGVGIGYVMLRALLAAMPRFTLPWAADVRLNLPILLFTLASTILAGLFFGCIPAWYGSRVDPGEALKQGGHASFGVGRSRLQRILVIGEFALALALLAGMGLAVRSFSNLLRAAQADLGLKTDHVLTFSLSLPKSKSRDPEKTAAYYKQMLSRIQSVPGVTSVSAQTGTPLYRLQRDKPFTIAGKPEYSDQAQRPTADIGAITPEYFKTFGVRLLKGRAFNDQDSASDVKVAVVNENFVTTYLSGADPLLQRISIQLPTSNVTAPTPPTELQIIGVYHDVRSMGLREDHPEVQTPFWQNPSPSPVIAVRTEEDPDSMLKSVAASIHSFDPQVPLARPRTMEQIQKSVLGYDRFTMVLFVSFGAVALLLATLGIFGVMAFSVAQRSREIAVRMALGADRNRVIQSVIKEGASLACMGMIFGTIGAYFIGRGMRSALFGIGTIDIPVMGGVALLLLVAALLASFVPARRAALVEPMKVLKTE